MDQLRGLISQAAEEFSKSYFEARETALYPTSYTETYRARVRNMHRALAVTLLLVTVVVWVLAFTVDSPATQAVFLKMALGPWGALIRYYTSLYNKRPTACGGKELFNVATWNFPLCVQSRLAGCRVLCAWSHPLCSAPGGVAAGTRSW